MKRKIFIGCVYFGLIASLTIVFGCNEPTSNYNIPPSTFVEDCFQQCSSDAALAATQYCGTDKKTYAACAWECNQTPVGVQVWPGACQQDGTPAPNGPPEPADGDTVCSWGKVEGQWMAVECADDLDDAPDEDSAQLDTEEAFSPLAPRPTPPASIDHRARFVTAKNQGSTGACTAFGLVAMLESAIARELGDRIGLSEMHLWSRYYTPMVPRALSAARAGGVATMAQAEKRGFSYDAPLADEWMSGAKKPDSAVIAALDKEARYEIVASDVLERTATAMSLSVDNLIAALAEGDDLFGAFRLGNQWFSVGKDGMIPDYELAQAKSGHAVAIVGYKTINNRLYFILRNSWSAGWGDAGYGYISAETLAKSIMIAFKVSIRRANAGVAPNCKDNYAADLAGTCRQICEDTGFLAEPNSICRKPGVCSEGQISDAVGICVTPCKAMNSQGKDVSVSCAAGGCTWKLSKGFYGCANTKCDKFCAAPNCRATARTNEFGVTEVGCESRPI